MRHVLLTTFIVLAGVFSAVNTFAQDTLYTVVLDSAAIIGVIDANGNPVLTADRELLSAAFEYPATNYDFIDSSYTILRLSRFGLALQGQAVYIGDDTLMNFTFPVSIGITSNGDTVVVHQKTTEYELKQCKGINCQYPGCNPMYTSNGTAYDCKPCPGGTGSCAKTIAKVESSWGSFWDIAGVALGIIQIIIMVGG